MEWSHEIENNDWFWYNEEEKLGYSIWMDEESGLWRIYFWARYNDLSKDCYIGPNLEETPSLGMVNFSQDLLYPSAQIAMHIAQIHFETKYRR